MPPVGQKALLHTLFGPSWWNHTECKHTLFKSLLQSVLLLNKIKIYDTYYIDIYIYILYIFFLHWEDRIRNCYSSILNLTSCLSRFFLCVSSGWIWYKSSSYLCVNSIADPGSVYKCTMLSHSQVQWLSKWKRKSTLPYSEGQEYEQATTTC